MTLSLHGTLELVQTKYSMSSHSVRFSSKVLNLSSKVSSKLLWLKKIQKGHTYLNKLAAEKTRLITQISKFQLIYEKSHKISILISSLLRVNSLVSQSTEPNDLSSFFPNNIFPLCVHYHCCV